MRQRNVAVEMANWVADLVKTVLRLIGERADWERCLAGV
jgi:hypothetical protein